MWGGEGQEAPPGRAFYTFCKIKNTDHLPLLRAITSSLTRTVGVSRPSAKASARHLGERERRTRTAEVTPTPSVQESAGLLRRGGADGTAAEV